MADNYYICVARRHRGAELPQGFQGRRLLPVRLLHLEEERPGAGKVAVPVDSRALPVRLEADREAPVPTRATPCFPAIPTPGSTRRRLPGRST